jgi:hypothetical protein
MQQIKSKIECPKCGHKIISITDKEEITEIELAILLVLFRRSVHSLDTLKEAFICGGRSIDRLLLAIEIAEKYNVSLRRAFSIIKDVKDAFKII